MSSALHRIAGAGNAATLVLVVMALANSRVIFESPRVDADSPLPSATGLARAAVLVVIDGLRTDTAENPEIMPNLCRLANSGGWGRAQRGVSSAFHGGGSEYARYGRGRGHGIVSTGFFSRTLQ